MSGSCLGRNFAEDGEQVDHPQFGGIAVVERRNQAAVAVDGAAGIAQDHPAVGDGEKLITGAGDEKPQADYREQVFGALRKFAVAVAQFVGEIFEFGFGGQRAEPPVGVEPEPFAADVVRRKGGYTVAKGI